MLSLADKIVYNVGRSMYEKLERKGSWLYIFLFVGFANLFLFHSFGAVAAALIMLGICTLVIGMFRNSSNSVFARLYLATTIVLSLSLQFVRSPEKYVLIGLSFGAVTIVAGYSLLNSRWVSGILELFLSPIMMGLSYLTGGIRFLVELMSGNFYGVFGISNIDNGSLAWFKSILIGVVLGIPLVLWLTSTLSQADPIFASYTNWIFTQDFWDNWLPRTIFSLFILGATIPSMFMSVGKYISPLYYLRKVSWSREVVVVTAMVVAVLLAFLVIQWPYVFVTVAKETDLSRFGVATYSEYVQRGFWDLLKVAGMVFGVAWAGLLFGKNSRGMVRRVYFGLETLLGVEFVIFITSIFRRVWLYQSYHGLSLARLYGLVLLIWIMGMAVTMMMRYLYPKIAWVRVEMAWIMVVILGTIGINLEKLVVKYPPTVNGRVDYVYLSRLPGDGYEGWVKAYDWAKQTQLAVGAQSGTVSRDSRRDIYYAWYVSVKLLDNYNNLISRYGSEDEVKDYYLSVIEAKRDTLGDNMLSDREKEQMRETLDKVQNALNDKNWANNISIGAGFNQMMFGRGTMQFGSEMDTSLYSIGIAPIRGRLAPYDRLLSWSGAEAQTYQKMKRDIGTEGFLGLQRQNIVVMKLILSQPKAQRDFDVDISFDSPFMR